MPSFSCLTKVIVTPSFSEFTLFFIHNFDKDRCGALNIFPRLPVTKDINKKRKWNSFFYISKHTPPKEREVIMYFKVNNGIRTVKINRKICFFSVPEYVLCRIQDLLRL